MRSTKRLLERRVSPSPSARVLLLGIHRVVDEHVGVTHEVDDPGVEARLELVVHVALELVVGHEADDGVSDPDAVGQHERRVTDSHHVELDAVDLVRALVQVLELRLRRHEAERYREVDRPHLPREEVLHADLLLLRRHDPDDVLRVVQRPEEGESLDVIPVEVRQKDVDRVGPLLEHARAERSNARARVEDESGLAAADLDTGGVAAVPDRAGSRRWNRAPRPPEAKVGARRRIGIAPAGPVRRRGGVQRSRSPGRRMGHRG